MQRIFAVLVLLVASASATGTIISQDVATSTTWWLAQSPYTITNDIQIASGATLVIQAGVVIFSRGGIAVNGALSMKALPGPTGKIVWQSSDGYTGIAFSYSSSAAPINPNFNHTVFIGYSSDDSSPLSSFSSSSPSGIELALTSAGVFQTWYITDFTLESTHFLLASPSIVWLDATDWQVGRGSKVEIALTGNTAVSYFVSGHWSDGSSLSGVSSFWALMNQTLQNATFNMQGNTLYHNLYVTGSQSTIFVSAASVLGVQFAYCQFVMNDDDEIRSTAVIVVTAPQIPVSIFNCTFIGPGVTDESAVAVQVGNSKSPSTLFALQTLVIEKSTFQNWNVAINNVQILSSVSATITVTNCLLVDNNLGISMVDGGTLEVMGSTIINNQIGIHAINPVTQIHQNNVCGNFAYDIMTMLMGSATATVNASANWWGTNNTQLIAAQLLGLISIDVVLSQPAPTFGFNDDWHSLCTPHIVVPNCTLGWYTNQAVPRCTPCARGTFNDIHNATSCFPCSAGTFASRTGSTMCTDCPLATWSDSSLASSCVACATGSSTNQTGSTLLSSCIPCRPGQAVLGPNQSCTACGAGFFTPRSSSTSCSPCDSGTVSFLAGTACISCMSGYFASGPAATCTSCPSGRFNTRSNSTTCSSCPAGMYSPTPTSCLACDAGNYSISSDSTSCQPCIPGKYTSFNTTTGYTYCESCPPGTYSVFGGSSTCTLCTPGRFASLPASTTCLSCGEDGGVETCSYGSPWPVDTSLLASLIIDPYTQSIDNANAYVGRVQQGVLIFGACILALVLLLPVACLRIKHMKPLVTWIRPKLKQMDQLFMYHYTQTGQSPVKRKTSFGGLVTAMSILAIFCILIAVLIQFTTGISPIQSFSPLPSATLAQGDFVVTLSLYGSGTPCSNQTTWLSCSAPNAFQTPSSASSSISVTIFPVGAACRAVWTCSKCSLTAASVSFYLQQTGLASWASALSYQMQLPSGSATPFSIQGALKAPSDTLFQGDQTESIFTVSVITTVVSIDSTTGLLAQLLSAQSGDTISLLNQTESAFDARPQTVNFQLNLQANPLVYRIDAIPQSLLVVLAQLISLAAVVITLARVLVGQGERVWRFFGWQDKPSSDQQQQVSNRELNRASTELSIQTSSSSS